MRRMADSPSENPPTPDWDRIEADYRAGIKSLRQIALENGLTHPAIKKRADKMDWSRDLKPKIHARAEELVSRAMVTSPVTTKAGSTDFGNPPRTTENAIVAANAQAVSEVWIGQRRGVKRTLAIFDVLCGELEMISNPEGIGSLERLIDIVRTPDHAETELEKKRRQSKQSDELAKILGIPERVDTFKRLIETQVKLHDLQRQAYGITEKTVETPPDAVGRLSDAERASRTAALLQAAAQRRVASQQEPTDVIPRPKAPHAS